MKKKILVSLSLFLLVFVGINIATVGFGCACIEVEDVVVDGKSYFERSIEDFKDETGKSPTFQELKERRNFKLLGFFEYEGDDKIPYSGVYYKKVSDDEYILKGYIFAESKFLGDILKVPVEVDSLKYKIIDKLGMF